MSKKKTQQSVNSEPKLVMVAALVPEPVKVALEALARKEERTVSKTLRRIIENTSGVKAALRNGRAA